jgi:hypothetical protein
MRTPRYADVAATLAVVIALGGTSYAVTALPRNSVGTAQLKAHAVTKAKLARGVSLAGPRGPQGPTGPAGAPGTAGAAGAPGAAGLSGVVIVSGGTSAVCPAGKVVIGGGARTEGVSGGTLLTSAPSGDGLGWVAAVTSPSVVASYAICATVAR